MVGDKRRMNVEAGKQGGKGRRAILRGFCHWENVPGICKLVYKDIEQE